MEDADKILDLIKEFQHCGAGNVYVSHETIGKLCGLTLAVRHEIKKLNFEIDRLNEKLKPKETA
jgi:hypothetical protein